MNKTYYTCMNRKNWIAFGILILSLPLLFINVICNVVALVLVTILFDGIVNYDMVVEKNKKLYVITKQSSSIWNFIGFLLLIIAFVCTLNSMYLYGVLIFYAVYFYIFIGNIWKSKKIKKIEIDSLFEHRNFQYFVYEVKSASIYDKNRYQLELVDHFDSSNKVTLVFCVSKLFTEYRHVCELFQQKVK